MHPYINIFGAQFPSYTLISGVGFFVMWFAAWLGTRKRSEIDQNHVPHIAVTAMAGLVIGAHILYGIVGTKVLIHAIQDGFSKIDSFYELMMFFGTLFGGMVFYGGLFGAIIGAYLYLKYVGLPYEPYFDAMAFCIPVFHGFARIGCFLGGCCYGVECKYGFVFDHSLAPEANGVTRFPVQLLESGLEFVLFAVILILYLKRKLSGKLMYVYLLSYAVIRFCDEFLRGDKVRGFVGPVSTSQFISLLILVVVPVILIVQSLRAGKTNDSAAVEDSAAVVSTKAKED